MGKFQDLTGQTFGQLTVLERAKNSKDGKVRWRCRCLRCGNECIVRADHLKGGQQKCGCGKSGKTHGMSNTKIHRKWKAMMQRCYNPNNPSFDDYGGRGIRVCERWHEFQNFYDDVSILPHFGEKGYTLDRIDNDGDYCPENVRWADRKTQNLNQRRSIKLEYNGEEMTLEEIAKETGLPCTTVHNRYYAGDRGADLFRPKHQHKQ